MIELYKEYLSELEKYTPEPFEEGTAEEAIKFYKKNRIDTKLIFSDGKLVGFLIVSTLPYCHPECDYFICQSYLKPEYRGKGLMTGAVVEWVKAHPGKYCLDIIFGNKHAKSFWYRRFWELGYIGIELPFYEHGVTGVCETLGFRPKFS